MDIINYLLFSLACFTAGVGGLWVEPFDSINFDGPLPQHSNAEGCVPFSDGANFLQDIRSLKTDSCIMLYKDAECQSDYIRVDPGEYPDLGLVKHASIDFVGAKAYWSCVHRGEGRPEVHVAVYGTAMIIGDDQNPPYNGLLHRYRNICECVNLQTRNPYIGTVAALHNFGNCIKLYDQRNCEGTSLELLGGVSPESRSIPSQYSFVIPSASVGLCQPRQDCHSLTIEVYKFFLTSTETEEAVANRAVNVSMDTEKILGNSGTVPVTDIYEASVNVEEMVEVTRIPSFSFLSNNFRTSSQVSYELLGSWFWNPENVKEAVVKAYQTSDDASSNGDKFTSKTEKPVAMRQHIDLQPCSEHIVDVYVMMAKQLPVDYEFYATVSGRSRDGRLMAGELEQRLTDGLVYVQDVDNSTIMVRGAGTILVEVSLNTFIDNKVRQLGSCLAP